MTTLDLRGSGGTLRLSPNGGTASVRSFVVIGPTGLKGDPGATGATGPQGLTGPSGPALPAAQVASLSTSFVGRVEAASYTYNPDGTVASETTGGATTTYTYNADGSVHTATRSGVTLTYTYNADGSVAAVA